MEPIKRPPKDPYLIAIGHELFKQKLKELNTKPLSRLEQIDIFKFLQSTDKTFAEIYNTSVNKLTSDRKKFSDFYKNHPYSKNKYYEWNEDKLDWVRKKTI